MKIGDKLKLLRENNKMTRKDVADKLKDFGFDISDKTLYGYESGRNSANADMFLALCKIYKCNNIMETFSNSVDDVLFTNSEWNIIEKYRSLDEHGKDVVDVVLDKEYTRCENAAVSIDITPFTQRIPNAAHDENPTEEQKINADNIMDDDNEWK